ncbi:MAG: succinylglutamate desuccinylase/aspartoacylase family protein [Dongiaceae bacterium]
MATLISKVQATVDFEKTGKQFGYLDVPHSRDDSGWGTLRVPIAVIKNGSGPTILFTGGNHGDEYEGQIALVKLGRALDPKDVAGRVILLPFLNLPAARAGKRTSPIDAVNMNRAFPGERKGTVSQLIAHFVSTLILPLCDAVMDFHAGGKTMMYQPFACIHRLEDKAMFERSKAALLAIGAPISLILQELDAEGMLDTQVESMGKMFLAAELGGGGTTTPATVGIADRGVRRVLAHLGITRPTGENAPPTRFMDTAGPGCYSIANHGGLFEMLVEMGGTVQAGEPLAQIHSMERPGEEPIVYRAERDGMLIGRHHPAIIQQGDFMALLAYDAA